MIVTKLSFECFDNTTLSLVEPAINDLLDALRDNGQILGREFPIVLGDGVFTARVVCPEKNSLLPRFNSVQVNAKLQQLAEAYLLSPKYKILGRDINSEQSAENVTPSWQVLYTTYVHTCSPLRCGDTLMPIPLYHLPPTYNGSHKAIIKWQTEWQACDEIQMAGSLNAEFAALDEIQQVDSRLFQKGLALRKRIEEQTSVPTYYYQYRVGGESLESESARRCPLCQADWQLETPLHDLFHFKCDNCRLVSNLSWDFQ